MITIRNEPDSHLQLSEHFKAYELSCKCGKCYLSFVSENLLFSLATMRKLWGLPISPSSVFRCQEHNRAVGGVPYSYHCRGEAVDLPLPADKDSWDTFISIALAIFPYVKEYRDKGFIHCDVRDV